MVIQSIGLKRINSAELYDIDVSVICSRRKKDTNFTIVFHFTQNPGIDEKLRWPEIFTFMPNAKKNLCHIATENDKTAHFIDRFQILRKK